MAEGDEDSYRSAYRSPPGAAGPVSVEWTRLSLARVGVFVGLVALLGIVLYLSGGLWIVVPLTLVLALIAALVGWTPFVARTGRLTVSGDVVRVGDVESRVTRVELVPRSSTTGQAVLHLESGRRLRVESTDLPALRYALHDVGRRDATYWIAGEDDLVVFVVPIAIGFVAMAVAVALGVPAERFFLAFPLAYTPTILVLLLVPLRGRLRFSQRGFEATGTPFGRGDLVPYANVRSARIQVDTPHRAPSKVRLLVHLTDGTTVKVCFGSSGFADRALAACERLEREVERSKASPSPDAAVD